METGYIVLACKGEDRTYSECDTLEESYEEADRLSNDGWKILEIHSIVYKERYNEEREYLLYTLKTESNKINKKNLNRVKVKEIKQDIYNVLFEKEICTEDLEGYIDCQIEELLGWDEITECVNDFIIKRLNKRRS